MIGNIKQLIEEYSDEIKIVLLILLGSMILGEDFSLSLVSGMVM